VAWGAVATATQCLAIATVPIGARVLAGNPRPDEFDDSFPEPVQSEWARVSFLIVRDDLSIVEAEFIRPREWIESLGLVKGTRLDLAVPELEIDGLAEVTAVRDCPPIAEGEGRVVTGRFVTREAVNVITVRLANGTEIRATDVHPVWSVEREDWVPAGKLAPGEHVDALEGPVAVVSVERLESPLDAYNIEVHGEHVFRVTADGVLVHNACPEVLARGQKVHDGFAKYLDDALGLKITVDRTKPGLNGVDVSFGRTIRGLIGDDGVVQAGFRHAELKPDTPSGIKSFLGQLNRWRDNGLRGNVGLFVYNTEGLITFMGVF